MKRFKVFLIAGFGLALASPTLLIWSWTYSDHKSIEASLAKLKAMGYVTTVAELKAQAPPAAENAAPYYDKLFAHLDRTPELQWSPKDPLDLPFSAKTIRILDREKVYFDQLDIIRLRPKMWFPRHYELGYLVEAPEARKRKQMVRWLAARGVIEAARGDSKSALRRLETMRAMQEHCESEPLIFLAHQWESFHSIRMTAALTMALRSHDLEFLGALRPVMLESKPPMDIRKYLGELITSTMGPIDLQQNHSRDWILDLPMVKNRFRALTLRTLVKTAQLAEDGLQTGDSAELERFQDGLQAETPLNRVASGFYFNIKDYAEPRTKPEKTRAAIAALDILIERAGGPRAKLDKDIVKTVSGNKTWLAVPAVYGSTNYFVALMGPDEVKLGRSETVTTKW